MRKWIFRSAALSLVLAGSLGGLIALGQWALEQIRERERYTIAFADIACTPPPGLDRGAFLDEVQYLAGLPARLCLLDEDLGERLAKGFGQHPWVAKVAEINLVPPKQIHAQLQFRRPVLAVPFDKTLRAVDGQGVLLPRAAPTDGLPVFPGTAKAPAGPAGAQWGDPKVESMARALAR
jgi:hypothetical protein